MRKYKILFILLICIFNMHIKAQNKTTNDTSSMPMGELSAKNYIPIYAFRFNTLFPEINSYTLVDTSIYNIHRSEILASSRNLYAHSGLIGQACYPMNFTFQRNHGFVYKTLPYSIYHRSFENWVWHFSPESYTRVDYEWASGKENLFNVVHTQTIDNFQFELDFNTMIAEGLYVRQLVRDINVGTRLSYHTPKNRYGFHFAYIFNLFYLNENGGVANDSLFESGLPVQSISVKFNNAENNYQDHDIFFRQYINLSKNKTINVKDYYYLGYIVHDFEFSKLKSLYSDHDLNLDYYNTVNYDSLFTFDSVSSYQIKNSLMWTNYMNDDSTLMNRNHFFHLALGVSHTYIKVGDSSSNFYNYNITPFATIHLRFIRYLNLKMNCLYSFHGYNDKDITAGFDLSWEFENNKENIHTLALKSNFYRYQPDYFYTYYFANTYNWKNTDLKKQQLFQVGIEWNYNPYIVDLNYYTLQHTILIGEDMKPMQMTKAANIMQLAVLVPFRYKGFGFDANMYVQYCDQKYIPMPWFAGRGSVFYGFPMFKKAMFLQLGLEMLYNTPYYANGYNPVMQQFYYQNDKKIGNYTYFDFFANVKVSRFYFHFVLGNFLADVFPKTYFSMLHYPSKGLNFKVGVSWRFHD